MKERMTSQHEAPKAKTAPRPRKVGDVLGYFANPTRFRRVARPLQIVAGGGAIILFTLGLYYALIASPPDYQQGETVRIMYIHVPAAWLALMTYSMLAVAGLSFIVWRHIVAGLFIRAAAPIGATFTLICLVTGALWGQPTWGTWWVWDARLTSVLILLFLYAGIMALSDAFENRDKSLQAASWLALVGFVNIPIIKFSVDWWNTLHQPASISTMRRVAEPAIDPSMLTPLLVMAGAYLCLFVLLAIMRLENEMKARQLESRQMRRAHG